MSEFINIVLGYPTAIFTTLLLISVGYWVISLAFGLGEGGDLGAEGLDGVDGIDVGDDVDVSGDMAGGGWFVSLIQALDLHLLPLSLAISVISLVGWAVSAIIVTLASDETSLNVGAGIGVILVALSVAVAVTGRLGRLLAPLFVVTPAVRRRDLVGRLCTVRTGRVDEHFGQAEVVDAEAGSHIIQIRCSIANDLSAGAPALIVAVNEEGEFIVSPDVEALT